MPNVSPHISVEEYRCGGIANTCCGKLPPDLYRDGQLLSCYVALFDAFESIRSTWGKPITITSGFRCKTHNQAVGGEPLSAHLWGLALDLYVPKTDTDSFVNIVRESGHGLRIGWKKYDDPLVHIDCIFYVWPRASGFWVNGVEW